MTFTGSQKAHNVYVTPGVMHVEHRQKLDGSRLTGQIPIQKGNEAERKRKGWILDQLRIYHASMGMILEPLERAAVEYVILYHVISYDVI